MGARVLSGSGGMARSGRTEPMVALVLSPHLSLLLPREEVICKFKFNSPLGY